MFLKSNLIYNSKDKIKNSHEYIIRKIRCKNVNCKTVIKREHLLSCSFKNKSGNVEMLSHAVIIIKL